MDSSHPEAVVRIRTVLKLVVPVVQGLVTVGLLIWYTANWKESVDKRLEDIDKDLKSIHDHYNYEPPYQLNSLGHAPVLKLPLGGTDN